jgi:hypothetical protein
MEGANEKDKKVHIDQVKLLAQAILYEGKSIDQAYVEALAYLEGTH